MILSDTPYPEIFLAMQKEEEKVNYALNKEERKAMRSFDRSLGMCGLCYTAYYTNPTSKNRYLLWYYMPDNSGPMPRYQRGSALLLDAPNGNRKLISTGTYEMNKGIMKDTYRKENVSGMIEFNGHFLSRYRERAKFPRSLSTDDLIATLFGRCMKYMTRLTMEKMNFRHEQYENGMAWRVADGISFGSQAEFSLPDGRTFVLFQHKTFVPEGMLKGEQRDDLILTKFLRSLQIDAMKENSVKAQLRAKGIIDVGNMASGR